MVWERDREDVERSRSSGYAAAAGEAVERVGRGERRSGFSAVETSAQCHFSAVATVVIFMSARQRV